MLALPLNPDPATPALLVLLASPDPGLTAHLDRIFKSLRLPMASATDSQAATAAMHALETPGILLLDVRLPGVANGQLLAAIHESGLRKRCPIALIAEQVSDEWIARLREGVIDDIVPRNADASAWNAHVSTMQRGHALYCELERLRETAPVEVRHDAATGVYNRETMLSILFRETDRVQRTRGTLCVVVFRVDGFSNWTAKLGLQTCDGILREIAQRASRTLRSYDLLGRSGRDEFLLALPGCSTINAVMMAERLRMEVFGDPFPVKGADRPVRLSACFGITSSRGRSPVVVVREAEETLARGRESGPDAIHCASESPLADGAEMAGLRLFPGAEVLV